MKLMLAFTGVTAFVVLSTTPAYAHDVVIRADCQEITVSFARFPDLPNVAYVQVDDAIFEHDWQGRESSFTTPSPGSQFLVTVTWDTNGHQGEASESFALEDCQPETTTTTTPATTTTQPPTTTTLVTTTTAPPPTTVTAPPPTTVTAPPPTVPTLAYTGAGTTDLVFVAVGLILLGVFFWAVTAGRQR